MRILSRQLSPREKNLLTGELAKLLAHYQANPKEARELVQVGESKPAADLPPVELAAWTLMANTLFNLDESLNK